MNQDQKKVIFKSSGSLAICICMMVVLSIPFGMIPPLGNFLLPGTGIWDVPDNYASYEEIYDENLNDEVKIYRDEFGVPHIYGSNEEDLMFALGYCHAQDRIIQMDLIRRSSRGTLSELVGSSALETDKFNILKMEAYWANLTYIEMKASKDPQIQNIRTIMEKYVAGVNLYISTSDNARPFEYQFLDAEISPWDVIDTLVYAKYISEYFTWGYSDFQRYSDVMTLGKDNYTELFGFPAPYQIPVVPNYGEFDTISVPPSLPNPSSDSTPASSYAQDSKFAQFSKEFANEFLKGISQFPQEAERINPEYIIGSNNWVISGNKTESGLPLLCNDMHLGWSLPGMWHEAHLIETDSDLNVYAVFLPGVPLPVAGHTNYLGWGETIAAFDMQDWYYYNGINETHYEYKGEPIPYEVHEVLIPVKGNDPVSYRFNATVHGPVFTNLISVPELFEDSVIACKWVSQNITYDYLALYGYMHAKDVHEFDEASKFFACLPLNIAFGDVEGNIGMRPNAKVPIRNDSNLPDWHIGNGRMPYNGSKGEGEWIGYVDFDDLPVSINPEQGYLTSANQQIAGPDFPNVDSINGGGSVGYRARRLNTLLASGNEFTINDMKEIQLDLYSPRAGNFTPYLINALASVTEKTKLQQDVYDELVSWDYIMLGSSPATTIFNIWNDAYLHSTFYDDMDLRGDFSTPSWAVLEYLTKEEPNSKWFDNVSTSIEENRDSTILYGLEKSLSALEKYYGTDDISAWKWGDIHQLTFDHLLGLPGLGVGPFPGNGTSVTVNPSYTQNFVNWEVRYGASRGGPSERIIVDFSNMNNSLSVIPSGESAISSSEHYADQLTLFLRGEFHNQYFKAEDPDTLEKWCNVESILVLKKEEK
ncbi:penicillin acylase family protein [Candidatus Lokiarchaeum ossiferum]|uniref:penicillin acylase family protein n=1 Tax=Candidatus Lokiarchaeum ossiferum TaxID=2951803 RepID=UPI00352EEF4B